MTVLIRPQVEPNAAPETRELAEARARLQAAAGMLVEMGEAECLPTDRLARLRQYRAALRRVLTLEGLE
jgi:hypothetical protein